MTFISVLTLNLAGSGKRKPFFCGGLSFHFWHSKTIYELKNIYKQTDNS
jgi:hypothetical protein